MEWIKVETQMWTKYEVQMDFVTPLCASVPANPNMINDWLKSRAPKTRPPGTKSIAEVAEEVASTLPEMDDEGQASLLVFQRIEGGPVVRMSTLRSHYKECARTISSLYVGKLEGEKSFNVKVLHGAYYPPENYWTPILDQGTDKPATEISRREKAIHFTFQGRPMSALKCFEYIENARLRFVLNILSTKAKHIPLVGIEDLMDMFGYGGVHGYGGERSDGQGRYITMIRQLEK